MNGPCTLERFAHGGLMTTNCPNPSVPCCLYYVISRRPTSVRVDLSIAQFAIGALTANMGE